MVESEIVERSDDFARRDAAVKRADVWLSPLLEFDSEQSSTTSPMTRPCRSRSDSPLGEERTMRFSPRAVRAAMQFVLGTPRCRVTRRRVRAVAAAGANSSPRRPTRHCAWCAAERDVSAGPLVTACRDCTPRRLCETCWTVRRRQIEERSHFLTGVCRADGRGRERRAHLLPHRFDAEGRP